MYCVLDADLSNILILADSSYLPSDEAYRQTKSFIEISIEAGILLGGKHEACFVLGLAGIEPMPS